jgi:hypothetical protein
MALNFEESRQREIHLPCFRIRSQPACL